MPRSHDRTDFFKFASRGAAEAMIKNRTLRWSTPLLFNDPFDTQTRLVAKNIDANDFVDAFTQRYAQILFDDQLPAFFSAQNKLHAAANITRQKSKAEKYAAIDRIRESALSMAANFDQILAKYHAEITNHLQHGLIICLTEDINNVVMWSHYSENHKGIAFKFRVLDALDHPFLVAKKVTYSKDYVNWGSAQEIADHLFNVSQIDMIARTFDLVYLKHQNWSYEQEWRCYYPLIHEEVPQGYKDLTQRPELFEAIYLGCNMPEDEVREYTDLTRKYLPQTAIFKGQKSQESFDLNFAPIYTP
jgi:hypothetical protein